MLHVSNATQQNTVINLEVQRSRGTAAKASTAQLAQVVDIKSNALQVLSAKLLNLLTQYAALSHQSLTSH